MIGYLICILTLCYTSRQIAMQESYLPVFLNSPNKSQASVKLMYAVLFKKTGKIVLLFYNTIFIYRNE